MASEPRDDLVEQARVAVLGTLCGGIAHEMSNPLSYILANLRFLADELPGILRQSPDASRLDAEQSLADALEGVERLETLVGTLRGYARGDAERRGPVDVRATLERALTLAKSDLRRRARVVPTFEGSPVALANEVGLVQVVIALLLHASRYFDPRDSDHEIALTCATNGHAVEIAIRFEPPVGMDGPARGEPSDLAMCRRVVASLDGAFRIAREDRKTTYFVSLHAHAPPQAARDSLPPRAA